MSPVYNATNQNPMMQMMGSIPGFQEAYAKANQIMQMTHQTPQQIVTSMMQSGQFTQDQFNRAAMMANMLTGKR